MAMVLSPILKTSGSAKLSNSSSSARVSFNFPDESNIVEYLKSEDVYKHSVKLSKFISKITHPTTEDQMLLRWIQDFKDNILFLENNERLVTALMNLNWYSKDDEFVRVYQDFILNVVTAHPSFLKQVLAMVLKIFYTVYDASDGPSETETKYFQNGHKLLYNILKLVPLSENPLCILLAEKFPYMKHPTKMLLCYVKNLFHLSSYLPSKRLIILECIIEKLIHIDVNCSRSSIEISEKEHDEKQDENTELVNSSLDTSAENKMADPLAHTLDVILDAIYEYIQKTCYPNGDDKLNWEATKKLYKEFLTVFDKIILPTHGSCHCQFIMFYICSFKSDLSDGFIDYLWKKVQNPMIGPVFRQISSFYIGSFLARAKYINISTVKACLDLMCRWIHGYISNHTSQELNVHGTFHSVCQTVFYTFAFRSQELLEIDKGYQFLRTLNFDRIVTSRLNPLRYCDRTIVHNFANIARNFQIAYVYPVIEKNNRNLLYLNQEQNAENYCAGAMIQTFFPFDPYLLKLSKKWIEQNYRIYSHCQKEDEAMDTADEADADICDSLFTYGSSPGFKKSYLFNR